MAGLALLLALVLESAAVAETTTLTVGINPVDVAIDPTTGLAYVSVYQSDSVVVIDTASHEIVRAIPVQTAPTFLAISPARSKLFIGHETGHVTILHLDSDAQTTLAGGTREITIDEASGKVYSVGCSLTVIDADAESVLAVVLQPHETCWQGVALNALTRRLYVSEGNWVRIFDADTYDPLGAIDLSNPSTPFELAIRYALAVDASRDRVYVGLEAVDPWRADAVGELVVLRGDTNEILERIEIGSFPGELVLDAAGETLFVAVTDHSIPRSSILVFRTLDMLLVREELTDYLPLGLALTPDESHIYVAENAAGTVRALPTEADPVVGPTTITVGKEPIDVAMDPATGLAYVSNEGSGSITVIDTDTGRVVRAIAVGDRPAFLAISASRQKLFISLQSGQVTVLDLQTEVQHTIEGGALGIAIDDAGGRVYSVFCGLTVIDANTHAVIQRLSPGVNACWYGAALNATTRRIYLADPGEIRVFDMDTYADLGTIAIDGVSFAIAVDEARDLLYLGRANPGTVGEVVVVDGATHAILRRTDIEVWPGKLALDAAGERLFVTMGTGPSTFVVAAYRASNLALIAQMATGVDPLGLALTPDERLIYVANYGGTTVSVVEAPGVPPNSAPAIDLVAIDQTAPRTADVLRVEVEAHDPDGDPIEFTYQWIKNGTPLEGATAPTLDLSIAGNGDRGDKIAVRVTASDGRGGYVSAAAAPVTIVNSEPTTSVTLTPTSPTKAATLVASAESSDADGDLVTHTFVWSRNGVVRQTTTTTESIDTYDLRHPGNGTFGDVITVEVTVSDGVASGGASAAVLIGAGRPH